MKIVLLGSGNVATHLAKAFKEGGQELMQIWSRSLEHARQLAESVQALAINELSAIDLTADLYVISVKDEAIAGVAERLRGVSGLVVHTSGSTPMTVLSGNSVYGVLYPLQTFSKAKKIDFKKVPLCIEAGNAKALQQLKVIAGNLSEVVDEVDGEQRKILHLAAVFACNFTNHLYHISQQLLESNGLNFDLLKPLIVETADKINGTMPKEAQTGPAVRGDDATIKTHLNMLQEDAGLQEMYIILSRSIKKTRQ